MPEGLEKDLPAPDLADLIVYVRGTGGAAKPKTFDGNKPELVKPGTNGSLTLTAANAAIYGPSLVLEKQFGNLGWWSSPQDRAVWTVAVPSSGRYEVWLNFACDNGSAGNTFVIESGRAN